MSDLSVSTLSALSTAAASRIPADYAVLRQRAQADRQTQQTLAETARAGGNVTPTRGQLVNILA